MTKDEQASIDRIFRLASEMRAENNTYREQVAQQVAAISAKVEEKHLPISLEGNILQTIQQSMDKAIGETLKGYNSPLLKLIANVVESRSEALRVIITSSFDEVIALPEFKQSIVAAFSHKVAKTIISNNDGLFDKVANELKQDAIFKSKMQLAVSNVVEQCLTNL